MKHACGTQKTVVQLIKLLLESRKLRNQALQERYQSPQCRIGCTMVPTICRMQDRCTNIDRLLQSAACRIGMQAEPIYSALHPPTIAAHSERLHVVCHTRHSSRFFNKCIEKSFMSQLWSQICTNSVCENHRPEVFKQYTSATHQKIQIPCIVYEGRRKANEHQQWWSEYVSL